MSGNVKVCDLDPEIKKMVSRFRFRKEKNNAAIVLKIDTSKLTIVLDETYEDMTPDELQDELPAHQPRYVLYSYCYTHDDGRISYPLCFIHIHPAGVKPELSMMYSGSATDLIKETGLTKSFELRDLEEFTEEWLKSKLGFFK